MLRGIVRVAVTILLATFSSTYVEAQQPRRNYTAEELNKYEQIICFWKPGQFERAEGQLRQIGLDIVFDPPGLRFAACRSGV